MPAAMPHPLPDDGSQSPAVGPATAGGSSVSRAPAGPVSPEYPAALAPAPFLGGPDQDEILDWELAALPHEEELSEAYPEEDGTGPVDDEVWQDEISYVVLAAPGAAGPGAAADAGAAAGDPAAPAASAIAPEPGSGTAAPGPAPTSSPEDFAEGGAADVLVPGPELATLVDLVQREGLGSLDDDQLTGVLQAADRLAAWSASIRVAAVSGLAARRAAAGEATGDWRPLDHVDDEVAIALTLTRRSAGRLLELALGLDRLPLTRAALAAGLIDERRAEVITGEVAGLDDAHAAAVEKLIIGRAPGLTSGQLRALVRRAVLAADPGAARRRKEQALKDARVELFPETSGTAALAGRDLPPAAVLAADKHLTALAQAMKAAGQPGTLDILRAWAYLHLLSGQPAATLIPATTPGTGTGTPGTGAPGDGTPGGAGGGLPGGPAPSGLRGSVNLTMPLSAWLGWTQAPGDVPGFGPVDAEDSRTLAGLLARPGNQWCLSLTDPAGHPVAHACARHGPPDPAGPPRTPGSTGPHGRASPGAGPGPPVPGWLRGLRFTTLPATGCTHTRRSRGYQPSPALRHLTQIRNPTCTAPGCRRPATRCDLDHTTPYHHGGLTCLCNIGPACRHDHHCKQTPGWTLTQPAPGYFTWTTPGHRSHTTTPAHYPE